jgi:hypothetical protein
VTETSDDLLALTRQPWRWDWVPTSGDDVRAAWTAQMVELFEDWTRDGLAAVRSAWPAETATLTPDLVGRGAAEWLLERADRLPAWARLAWGAVFVTDRPRWAPVPVVVEFRRPVVEDSAYLMEWVGATGLDGDAREPVVDYITTPAGDGVRVFALARSADGLPYGRLDAAMRLDIPGDGDAAGVDVLLTTLVFEMGLMALIGPGVEQLMQLIAESAQGSDGRPAQLRFAAPAGGGKL